MIAETANLTTARNVVKEAEGQVASELHGCLEYQLQLGLCRLLRIPTKVGTLDGAYQVEDYPLIATLTRQFVIQENGEAQFMMIWREQTRTGECLTRRLSGKPLRTPVFELPARRGAEGGAE
jgi:hypothetical protein